MNIPATIDGTPESTSATRPMSLATRRSLPYSTEKIAAPSPIGTANADARPTKMRVP